MPALCLLCACPLPDLTELPELSDLNPVLDALIASLDPGPVLDGWLDTGEALDALIASLGTLNSHA